MPVCIAKAERATATSLVQATSSKVAGLFDALIPHSCGECIGLASGAAATRSPAKEAEGWQTGFRRIPGRPVQRIGDQAICMWSVYIQTPPAFPPQHARGDEADTHATAL